MSSSFSELTLNTDQEKSSILNNAYYCLAFQLKFYTLSMINMAKLCIDTRYVSFPPGFQPWAVCFLKQGELCPRGTEVEAVCEDLLPKGSPGLYNGLVYTGSGD